jgi:histidinol-phosphate aminotransferase
MAALAPPEQPAPGQRMIKLNTNENPFPPSPRVVQTVREVEPEALRRYPDPKASAFRTAAAGVLRVSPEMILAGNGADELLAVAVRTFVSSGGTLSAPEPTYALYSQLAKLSDAKYSGISWEKNWALPAAELLDSGADAIFVANPNTPSGTLVPPKALAELAAAFAGPLVIDEAYAEFADGNCLELVRDFANVIVVRSMSQAYSLAGLRFGYAIAQPEVIEEMAKLKDAYNCDTIAAAAAAAAIEDQEYATRTWEHVRNERTRMTSELESLGYEVAPSQANFILATCPVGRGKNAYLGLKQQGILVRYFDRAGLTDKIGITIGTSQENNALLGGLKSLIAAEKAA